MAEFVSTYVGNKFAHPAFIEIPLIFPDEFYHTPPENQDLILIFFYYFEEWQNCFLCHKSDTIPQCIDIFPSVGDSLLFFRCCVAFHSAMTCYKLYHIPASSININFCNALWIYRSRLRCPSASDFRSYIVQICPHQKVFSPANVSYFTIHNSIIYTRHNSSSFDTECRYTT